jgi:hypothetical protein
MNHPSTIEVRPGYGCDVIVTKDRVFSGAYKGLRSSQLWADRIVSKPGGKD